MRSQRFISDHFPVAFMVGLFLLSILPVVAQDELHPPQFLYRDENRLILVNGYTGEATELPIEITNRDYFEWSPDGKYLLARIHEREDSFTHCLNLYNVDLQVWVYDEPIACNVDAENVVFSRDATRIAYSTNDGINGALWIYSLADETGQELFRTTDGREIDPDGISHIEWSPTEAYLTFVKYHSVTGGTDNTFVVMNSVSYEFFTIHHFNSYYARYYPVWSANDEWFLLQLQEEYVTNAALPHTNHQGDVYLFNSETGEEYRLTYTPAVLESDIYWTSEGGIAFGVWTEQEFTFTIEEAMNVEVVPPDEIVMPESIDPSDYFDPLSDVMISPDTEVGAWVDSISGQQSRVLKIGEIYMSSRIENFSISISDGATMIGWRPSDYPYSRG